MLFPSLQFFQNLRSPIREAKPTLCDVAIVADATPTLFDRCSSGFSLLVSLQPQLQLGTRLHRDAIFLETDNFRKRSRKKKNPTQSHLQKCSRFTRLHGEAGNDWVRYWSWYCWLFLQEVVNSRLNLREIFKYIFIYLFYFFSPLIMTYCSWLQAKVKVNPGENPLLHLASSRLD